jgi:hypothetical protein
MKFKVGDKVVRIKQSDFGLTVGGVYIVKVTDGCFVIVEGNNSWHHQYHFDLYRPVLEEQISELEKRLEALKKQQAGQEAAKVVTYCTGQRFRENASAPEYMLAQVGFGMICLINVQTGNYYREAVAVSDRRKITTEEFQKIQGSATFTLIN